MLIKSNTVLLFLELFTNDLIKDNRISESLIF